jgi:DNA-directed RNA polymerase specialized sigma24 family protein
MTHSVPLLIGVGAVVLVAVVIWLRRRAHPRNSGVPDLAVRVTEGGAPSEEVLERLRAVVRGRPARERLVLILTEFERLTVEDTAHVLGISVEQVMALRHSIRGALNAAAAGQDVPASSLEPQPSRARRGT